MGIAKKIFGNTIIKNLSYLVTGTALAQVLIILFQLILRRIYTPADFGAFAVYMSIIGIIAVISSMRYEQTIILPADDNKAYNLLYLSFGIGLIISVLTAVLLFVFKQPFMHLINFPEKYSNWLAFVPLSLLLLSIYQALNYYLIRLKQFKLSASNKVERRIAEGVTQTISGDCGNQTGLVFGDIAGQSVNALAAGLKVHKFVGGLKLSWATIKSVAAEYKSFPLQNSFAAFLNALSLLLPTIFINRLFDEQTTGLFDLARMLMIMPLSLVTTSMGQVLVQRFTELRNKRESIRHDFCRIAALLAVLALVFAVVAFLLAPSLLALIFGETWRESGVYVRIMVWAFAFKFVVSPFNMVFTAFEKIGRLSVWQTIYFLLIFSLIFIPVKNIYGFLRCYLAVELFSYAIVALMTLKVVREYEKSIAN
ncbi:MAG: oligosaccharide flippase family protein [Salinivirgaceae bacterium]|nr:oligosaccharide flippase family protein [Salinivirgaceae bacterium]